MRKRLLILALVSASCSAQMLQGIVGGAAAAPAGTTVTFGGHKCSGAVSANCTWDTTPSAGQAIVGVVWTNNPNTLTTICDGGGADGCTGSSSYTIEPAYSNTGGSYSSHVFYTCSFAGSGNIIIVTSAGSIYSSAIATTGNTTTGTNCNDGYNKAQSITSGTTLTSGTVATTNAGDLLVGLMTDDCGGSAYTAGSDGGAGTYTKQINDSAIVTMTETLAKAATGTFSAGATIASACKWNAEVIAVK